VTRIGVIADTHNFLDARVPGLFAGVEHIVHAGDIGQPRLLAELARVAPVTAVAGNTDDPACGWPETATLRVGGHRLLLQHILDPHRPTPAFARRLANERPTLVIFGHTHQPYNAWHDGVCFLNPGSAGRSRFGLPRSVALLDFTDGRFTVSFHHLND
jgi:hypothetical protein